MMGTTIDEIARACAAATVRGDTTRLVERISIDTRTLAWGDFYVALCGETHDGHAFVADALGKGASGVLVEDRAVRHDWPGEAPVLRVRDTLRALGDVASAYRARFAMPFVAITGSNGKTTTKEMVTHVLSPEGKVVSARKSFNNAVGVPLTLFEVMPEAFAVVLEMGTSAPGEIRRLSEIARPTIGVITNVAGTHLEGLKTEMGVAAAKGELLEALGTTGTAILNVDNEWCRKLKRLVRGKLVTFGTVSDADVIATDVHEDTEGLSFTTNEHVRVNLSLLGRHQVHNALAAIAVCRRLGLDMQTVAGRLATFRGVPMRMELLNLGGVTVVNDTYNSNPVSAAAALDAFARLRTSGTRHFVCGDMLELGEASERLHRELGERIAAAGIGRLWLFGSEVRATRSAALDAGMDDAAVALHDTYEKLEKAVLRALSDGDVMLVKGSRGMRLERIVDALRARGGKSVKEGA